MCFMWLVLSTFFLGCWVSSKHFNSRVWTKNLLSWFWLVLSTFLLGVWLGPRHFTSWVRLGPKPLFSIV